MLAKIKEVQWMLVSKLDFFCFRNKYEVFGERPRASDLSCEFTVKKAIILVTIMVELAKV